MRQITGQPILFMGTGEKTDALEPFQAERVASRILGMGDVLSLVENVTRNVDREQAEKLARKLKKGKDFDLEDLHDQLQQVEKMGGLSALMDKLPASSPARPPQRPQAQREGDQAPDRDHPLDDAGRAPLSRRRSTPPASAASPPGPGVHVSEINRLLKSYLQMQKMMKTHDQGRRPAAADAGIRRAVPGVPPGGTAVTRPIRARPQAFLAALPSLICQYTFAPFSGDAPFPGCPSFT